MQTQTQSPMTQSPMTDTLAAERTVARELSIALRTKGFGKLADALCNANTAQRPGLIAEAEALLMSDAPAIATPRQLRKLAAQHTDSDVIVDVTCQGQTKTERYALSRALDIVARPAQGQYMRAVQLALGRSAEVKAELERIADLRSECEQCARKLRTLAPLSDTKIDAGWARSALRCAAQLTLALTSNAPALWADRLAEAQHVLAQTSSGFAKRCYALVNRQLASQQAGGVIVTQREAQRAMARVKRAMSRRYGKRVALSATLHSAPPTSALPVTCRLQPAMTSHVVRWQPTRPEHLFLIPATRAERYRARAMAMGPKAVYEAVALAQYAGLPKRPAAPTYTLIPDMSQPSRPARDPSTVAIYNTSHATARRIVDGLTHGMVIDGLYFIDGLTPYTIAPLLATCTLCGLRGIQRPALLRSAGSQFCLCSACIPAHR